MSDENTPLRLDEMPDAAKQVLRQVTTLYVENFKIVLAEAGINAPIVTELSETGFRVSIDRTVLTPEENARISALMQEIERRVQAANFTPNPDAALN